MSPRLLVLLLLLPGAAWAIDQETPQTGTSSTKTTQELLTDLHSDEGPDRLFASRALKGQLKRALNVESHAPAGSFAADEARSLLVELEERLPAICLDALPSPQVGATCAEMLALLDVKAAAPAIEALLRTETRKGPRRRIEAALAALQTP